MVTERGGILRARSQGDYLLEVFFDPGDSGGKIPLHVFLTILGDTPAAASTREKESSSGMRRGRGGRFFPKGKAA